MILKKFMTSVCIALFLGVSVMPSAAYARRPHKMLDISANAILFHIDTTEISALAAKVADLIELVTRNTSMGYIGAISSKMDLDKALGQTILESDQNISMPEELRNIDSFESAMEDAKKMSALITKELLPPVQDDEKEPLTDSQKVDRQKKRFALKMAAAADAYALAVAMQKEGTAFEDNVLNPARDRIGSAATMQDKQAAALDLALLRLTQLLRANEIAAMNLRLQAAEVIGDLPRDYGS